MRRGVRTVGYFFFSLFIYRSHPLDFSVNCESEGFPIESLSVAVAAPTAQPAPPVAVSTPDWATLGTVVIQGTQTLGAPTGTSTFFAGSGTATANAGGNGASPVVSWWTSSDSWGISVGYATASAGSFGVGGAGSMSATHTPGSTLVVSPTSDAVLPSTPISGSSLVTFVSPSPSASDTSEINQPADNASGHVGATAVSSMIGVLTSAYFLVMCVL